MTKEELTARLIKPINKFEVLRLAEAPLDKNFFIRNLIELTFHKIPEVAFRAAWILEHVYHNTKRGRIGPDKQYFVNAYKLQTSNSCKRHYTKIMMELLKRDTNFFTDSLQIETILESTFEWLIEPKTAVAVKVNCLDILFILKDKSDWVRAELPSQIAFLLLDGSAAMQSRGRKLLKKLS